MMFNWFTQNKEVPEPPVDKTGIIVRDANDRPKLKRVYVYHLDGQFKGFRIDLNREYKWNTPRISDERDGYGIVTQPDGKWVLVSLGNVAQHILNAELAPIIEETLSRMAAMDQEWIETNASEWTDNTGVTWVRKVTFDSSGSFEAAK